MKVSAFDVFNKMCDLDPEGKAMKAFMSPNNFKGANTGKNGWGTIKMAVDNQTILDLALENKHIKLVLFAYDCDEFTRVKQLLESTPQKDGEV